MERYSAEHWANVQQILYEAVELAGLMPDLVSNSDEVNIIQRNIVQNIYNNEIIICDISGRNPNVMFELGMRLTFDKLTVIVKDDETSTPFDTSILEYIPYRRDLRYGDIQDFKKKLAKKITATYSKINEPNYSPFIKSFGPFIVPRIEEKEVEPVRYLIENLEMLRRELRIMVLGQQETIFSQLNKVVENKIPSRQATLETLNKFLQIKKEGSIEHNNSTSLVWVLESEFYSTYPDYRYYQSTIRNRIVL